MTIVATHLTDGVATSFQASSASITPTADEEVYVWVACALNGGNVPSDNFTVVGCDLTWTKLGFIVYGTGAAGRRGLWLFRGLGAAPTTDTVDLEYTGASASSVTQELMWSIEQLSGLDDSTPEGTVASARTSDSTSPLSIALAGSPAAGDIAICGFACAESLGMAPEADYTALVDRSGGGNVRSMLVEYRDATADQSPSVSWTSTGAGGAAGIGLILKAAAGGSTDANVDAVPMAAAGDMVAASVVGTGTVEAVPMAAAGDMAAASVAAGSTVTAVPMAAVGDLEADGIPTSAEVGAAPMAAVGDMPAPTVGGNASVTAVPMAGLGDVAAAAVTAGSEVAGAPMAAAGDVPAPAVAADGNANVDAVPMAAAGDMQAFDVDPDPLAGSGGITLRGAG